MPRPHRQRVCRSQRQRVPQRRLVPGKRDGETYGSRAMIDQYKHRCTAFGVTPDEARYMVGWDDGNMEYRQRTGYGGGPD